MSNNILTLPICLGIDTEGRDRTVDLATMPNLLVSGDHEQEKSKFLQHVASSALGKKGTSVTLFDQTGVGLSEFKYLDNVDVCKTADVLASHLGFVLTMIDYGIQQAAKKRVIVMYGIPRFSCDHEFWEDLSKLWLEGAKHGVHLVIAGQRADIGALIGRRVASSSASLVFKEKNRFFIGLLNLFDDEEPSESTMAQFISGSEEILLKTLVGQNGCRQTA